jgi:hypothetical protein
LAVDIVPEVTPTAAPGEEPRRYPDRIVPKTAEAAAELKQRTLRNLYNERPRWLADAHDVLDRAVAAAYGWPEDISTEDALARLLALNLRGRGSRRGKSALTRGVRLEESVWQPVREARDPIAGLAMRESLRRGVSKSRPATRSFPVTRRLLPRRLEVIGELRPFGCRIPVAANKSLADPRSLRILSLIKTRNFPSVQR